MAEYIPKINLPVEGVEHARWLQRRAVKHDKDIESIFAKLATLSAGNAAGAQQTSAVNVEVRKLRNRVNGTSGVPDGGLDGDRLGKLSDEDYDFDWVRNKLGGMPIEQFEVDAGVGESTTIQTVWEPKVYDFQIISPADNTPYEIVVPDNINTQRELLLPFYVLSIFVHDFSVDLTLGGSIPHYADQPNVSLLGMTVVGDEGTVTIPAGFSGQWFVVGNFQNGDATAFPLNDSYHDGRFGASVSAGSTLPTVTATAAAGTSPTVTVTGTSVAGVVELATGTSPTTTGWGELLTFTNGWASGDVPVLSLYPANQAAAALNHYGARSGTEVEAHFDLTGIAASTTYKFHYSLLPFSAV